MKKVYRRIFEAFALLAFIGLAALLPLYLLSDKPTTIEINSDDDFIKYNFAGSGRESDPYIIEELTISDQLFRGISVSNTNKHFIIRNCFLTRNLLDGIKINSIAPGTALIFNNTIVEHSLTGILIINSDNVTILQNTIIESKYMIWLDNADHCKIESNNIYAYRAPMDKEAIKYRGIFVEESDFTTIDNNYIKNTAFGIYLISSTETTISDSFIHIVTFASISAIDCSNVEISSTTCLESFQDFFSFRYATFLSIQNCSAQEGNIGLKFYNSANCSVNYNVFSYNRIGIYIYGGSTFNNISYNELSNNDERGLKIESSSKNSVHHNAFLSNNDSVEFQAEDNGSNNTWFDSISLEGNYYQGWNSSLPYQIVGSANSSDPYPLESLVIFTLLDSSKYFHSEKTFNIEFFLNFSERLHDE